MRYNTRYFGEIIVRKLDEYPKLNKIGKNEIIKSYKQNGKIKDFFVRHFEKWENDVNEILFGNNKNEKIELKHLIEKVNIKKFIEIFNPPDIMFHNRNGKIIISLKYNLPDQINGLIIIELDEMLKLNEIKYCIN